MPSPPAYDDPARYLEYGDTVRSTSAVTTTRRRAPAQKTGLGAVRPQESPTKLWDQMWEGAKTGLETAGDAFQRYATQKGRQEKAFSDCLGEALESAVLAQGKELFEAAPFGKGMLLAFEVSTEFAAGVGEAIDETNARLAREYDLSQLSPDEITEADQELINRTRGYLARDAKELAGILERGLERVARKLLDELAAQGLKLAGKVFKDLADQVAEQLIDGNQLLLLVHDELGELAARIPSKRRRAEAFAFELLARQWTSQFTSDATRKRLEPTLKSIGSDKPIDVALLSSVLQLIVTESYKSFMSPETVAYAGEEMRELLIDQARHAYRAAIKAGIEVRPGLGTTLAVAADSVTVPEPILREIERTAEGPSPAEHRAWLARDEQFNAYVRGRVSSVEVLQRSLQAKIDASPDDPTKRIELLMDLQKQLQRAFTDARRLADRARDAYLKEFGNRFAGHDLEKETSLEIRTAFPTHAATLKEW